MIAFNSEEYWRVVAMHEAGHAVGMVLGHIAYFGFPGGLNHVRIDRNSKGPIFGAANGPPLYVAGQPEFQALLVNTDTRISERLEALVYAELLGHLSGPYAGAMRTKFDGILNERPEFPDFQKAAAIKGDLLLRYPNLDWLAVHQHVRSIVHANRVPIEKIASSLLDRQRLEFDDVMTLAGAEMDGGLVYPNRALPWREG